MSEIFYQVKRIIEGRFDIPPTEIQDGSDLREDLKLDSLDLVDLVMKAEETFCIEISEDEMEELRTVQDFADLVRRLMMAGIGGKQG